MQAIYIVAFIFSLFIAVHSSTAPNTDVGTCLSELATAELTLSYNYLQLASKTGANNAYPGFSSLYIKISDEDSSKGHELVKYIALRKFKLSRLIQKAGIAIKSSSSDLFEIGKTIAQARDQNKEVWEKVTNCHDIAGKKDDASVQDYLESHLLDHHIEVDKHLADLEQRIQDAQESERKLVTFMIDEELLQTYGDRRKDIFS